MSHSACKTRGTVFPWLIFIELYGLPFEIYEYQVELILYKYYLSSYYLSGWQWDQAVCLCLCRPHTFPPLFTSYGKAAITSNTWNHSSNTILEGSEVKEQAPPVMSICYWPAIDSVSSSVSNVPFSFSTNPALKYLSSTFQRLYKMLLKFPNKLGEEGKQSLFINGKWINRI